jgi:hypothetical protein
MGHKAAGHHRTGQATQRRHHTKEPQGTSMLTDDEILNSVNAAPLAQGPQSFVLAIGRAIEAKVLEKALLLFIVSLYERNNEQQR